MGMLLRRIAATLPVMAVVAVLVFLLIHLSPGDPAALIAGDLATTEDIARLRTSLGLDQPLWQQFAIWAGRIAHGDLGISIFTQVPVTELLAQRLEPTLSIAAGDDGACRRPGDSAGHAGRLPRRLLDRPRSDAVRGARLLAAGVPDRLPADLRLRHPPAVAAGAGLRAPGRRHRPVGCAPGAAVREPGARLHGAPHAHDPGHRARGAAGGLHPHGPGQGPGRASRSWVTRCATPRFRSRRRSGSASPC